MSLGLASITSARRYARVATRSCNHWWRTRALRTAGRTLPGSAAQQAGHDPTQLPVSINSHGYIADTATQARDEAFPPHALVMNRLGRERGWPPMTRPQFEALCSPHGALLIGSPDEVIEKILYEHELFGHQRLLLQLSVGPMPHSQIMRAIELYGTVVAPAVRKALG